MSHKLRFALSAVSIAVLFSVSLATTYDTVVARGRDAVKRVLGLRVGGYWTNSHRSFECEGVDRTDFDYDDCRVWFVRFERADFGIVGGWTLTDRVTIVDVRCDSCPDETIPQATWDKAVALVEAETGLDIAWDGGRYIGSRSRINPGGIALEGAALASLILFAAVASNEFKARRRKHADPPA